VAVTSLEVPYRADAARWPRFRAPRWLLPLLMALLMIGVVTGAALRIAYVYSFQPFGPGSGSLGPVQWRSVQIANDGLADTEYVLAGPPGSTATLQYPLANLSDKDVRVLGLGSGSEITSLGWTTLTDSTPRAFPMTLKPHESLTLLVTVTKPSYCGSALADVVTGIPLRFEALGVERTSAVLLRPGGLLDHNYIPIDLCVPEGQTVNAR
jgi:hypothetical protein